ncbi:hypothetical protein OROGR_013728 [Orobanche gracilis]
MELSFQFSNSSFHFCSSSSSSSSSPHEPCKGEQRVFLGPFCRPVLC